MNTELVLRVVESVSIFAAAAVTVLRIWTQ